ncbi:MAG: glycosyltransferase family 2 protein [Solirubrobacteraceae bacterium]|nr:glycosyltransferase family 2 protein [Solirubrobacteraceae bacterium]
MVIPAYNEEERLSATLRDVFDFLHCQAYLWEVIVVDDGSSDRTAEVACPGNTNGSSRVLSRRQNGGKGAATRDGIMAAKGEFILLMDADNSARITELPKLLEAARGGATMAIGSRYATGANIEVRQPIHRVVISRIGNRLIQWSVLPGIKDTQCGFKLLPQSPAIEIAEKLTRNRFSFDIELLVMATMVGLEVVECPINWKNHPDTKLRVFRSSIELLRDLAWIRTRYGPSSHRAKSVVSRSKALEPNPRFGVRPKPDRVIDSGRGANRAE